MVRSLQHREQLPCFLINDFLTALFHIYHDELCNILILQLRYTVGRKCPCRPATPCPKQGALLLHHILEKIRLSNQLNYCCSPFAFIQLTSTTSQIKINLISSNQVTELIQIIFGWTTNTIISDIFQWVLAVDFSNLKYYKEG